MEIRDQYGAEAVSFARGVSMNNNQIVTRLANVFGTPNIASINYFCYGPQSRRLYTDGDRQIHRPRMGFGRDRRFLRQAGLHRGVGLTEENRE